MIAIIEYGAGNQTSVKRALDYLRIPAEITADPLRVQKAEGIIFPGVGAARQAMAAIGQSGLEDTLRQSVSQGIPLLGICLGCQILLDHSEEENTDCLGLISGDCRKFEANLVDSEDYPIKIPHMGWNSVNFVKNDPLGIDIPPEAEFYFVHGYYVAPPEELVIATTKYGHSFCSIYGRPGLWGAQFHPEKSGRFGLQLLKNFYNYCITN